MDDIFGGYQAGSFRIVYVDNNYYAEDRVFVLLNGKNEPVGTGNAWQTPAGEGYVSWVGVSQSERGKSLGVHLTNYCLRDIKRRGLKNAIITTEKENHPAFKTYLKCGFMPLPRCEEDIGHWEEILDRLNLPAPVSIKAVRPENDVPHPPRPWPYQLAREKAARENGDLFVHGVWNRFNMYEVDRAEYGKLWALVSGDEAARERLRLLMDGGSGSAYVDSDVNPRAVRLMREGEVCLFGASGDGYFEDGIILFDRESAGNPA